MPKPIEPTRRQCEAAKRVQEQILHEAELLSAEGIDPHEMIAGMGSALADIIATVWGAAAVPRWFATQGALIEQLQGRAN